MMMNMIMVMEKGARIRRDSAATRGKYRLFNNPMARQTVIDTRVVRMLRTGGLAVVPAKMVWPRVYNQKGTTTEREKRESSS